MAFIIKLGPKAEFRMSTCTKCGTEFGYSEADVTESKGAGQVHGHGREDSYLVRTIYANVACPCCGEKNCVKTYQKEEWL